MMTLLLLLALATPEAPPVKGTLCFAGVRECLATTGTKIQVPAADAKRLFVWTRTDERVVVLDTLEASATGIDLEPVDSARKAIRLTVRGRKTHGWPAEVRYMLGTPREQWLWTLSPAAAGGETTIHVPVGSYRLTLGAPRHRAELRPIRAERDASLGVIELKPLPAVTGRVTRPQDDETRPVAGAQILLGSGKAAATTNEQGVFRAELDEPLPDELLVMSPGLATTLVPLPPLEVENDLGEIRLESGVTLTLDIDRPDELREKKLQFRLLRESRKYEHTVIARGDIAPGEDRRLVRDLSSGDYYVVVEGEAELERLVVPFKVGAGDLTTTVEIRPFRLDGRVLLGEDPLGGVTVSVTPLASGETWRARLPVDADGRFGGTAWQPGRLRGTVRLPGTQGGLLHAQSGDLGADPSDWTMQFRKRLIHGRIFDRETGAGIGRVEFRLQTSNSSGRGYSSVKVAPSGDYEIVAWEDGTYDLILTARDYVPATETVTLAETDGSRKIDIGLDRGSELVLELVWPTGERIAGAMVLEGVARDGHNAERFFESDAMGRLSLRMGEGETHTFFVIPREGSFLPVRVVGSRTKAGSPIRVEVPPPAGTLRLSLRDAEGRPSGGAVVMRYNGEWVPVPVTGRMRKNQTIGTADYFGLPSGAYELWAIRTSSGMSSFPNSPPTHAPVRVGLSTGESSAELIVVTLP